GRVVALAAAGIVLGYLVLAAVPEHQTVLIAGPGPGQAYLTVSHLILGSFGVLVFGITAWIVWRLLRRFVKSFVGRISNPPAAHGLQIRPTHLKVTAFLLMWLGLELAGYFAMTQFLAVRRVMGLVLVLTLIAGRLASRSCRSPQARLRVRGAVWFGMALGLL